MDLHLRSKSRSAQWPDALQLDEQEAAYRAEQRQKKLNAASQRLWEQSDVVKALHSRLLLSNVLAERAKQVSCAQQELARMQEEEAVSSAEERADLERKTQTSKAREAEARCKALAVRDARERQLEEFKSRVLAERAMLRLEGEKTREKASEEAAEQKQKEQESRSRALAAMRETEAANCQLQQRKMLELEEDRRADAAIAGYSLPDMLLPTEHASKKAEAEQRRKAEADAKAAAKEAHRQRIVNMVEQQLQKIHEHTEKRVEREVAAAKVSAEVAAAEQQRERQARLDDIDRSRREQLAQKQAQRDKESAAEAAAILALSQHVAKVKAEEAAQAAEFKKRQQEHMAFLLHQMELNKCQRDKKRAFEEQETALRLCAIAEHDERFQRYAVSQMQQWQLKGRSTLPAEVFLNGLEHSKRSIAAKV
ncbi:g3804 [Coccomyxa elongata]